MTKKNFAISILLALVTMSFGYSDATTKFNCTPAENLASDFQIQSVSFALNVTTAGAVTLVPHSLVSTPDVALFHIIEMNILPITNPDGAPLTSIDGDLMIVGRDFINQSAGLMAISRAWADGSRATSIDIYTGGNRPQEEHLVCKVSN